MDTQLSEKKTKKGMRLWIIGFFAILLIIGGLATYVIYDFYGGFYYISALRSQVMKNVVIPISAATITFVGVAVSIYVTGKNSRNQLEKTLRQDKEQLEKTINHEQQIKANEVVANNRMMWQHSMIEIVSDFIALITKIINLLVLYDGEKHEKLIHEIRRNIQLQKLSLNPNDEKDQILIEKAEEISNLALEYGNKVRRVHINSDAIRKDYSKKKRMENELMYDEENSLPIEIREEHRTEIKIIEKKIREQNDDIINAKKIRKEVFALVDDLSKGYSVYFKENWTQVKKDLGYTNDLR